MKYHKKKRTKDTKNDSRKEVIQIYANDRLNLYIFNFRNKTDVTSV